MMEIIRPLGVEPLPAAEQRGAVALVLDHQVHLRPAATPARMPRASSGRASCGAIAWVASKRRPSKRYSFSQSSALCRKNAPTSGR